jgi:hypothetical protein
MYNIIIYFIPFDIMEERTCDCCDVILRPFFIQEKRYYHKFCPECFKLLQKIDKVKENLLNLEFQLFVRMKIVEG